MKNATDIAMLITQDQRAELDALAAINAAIGGPTFISRGHWRDLYYGMVCKKLVKWGEPPAGFSSRRWAGAEVTPLGLAVRAVLKEQDNG